eukprot:TRINITY_DN50020_c0_g1_i1.p1 TRINITY_DN50020_c0_g1~~TRINITY_DN50020_c0_g1_i1.p1  ORF type:complete len:138 (+),score=9.84 TRINITY_DN50020_c0_g1_i1:1-414(+)
MPDGSFVSMEAISTLSSELQQERDSICNQRRVLAKKLQWVTAVVASCASDAKDCSEISCPPSQSKAFSSCLRDLLQSSDKFKSKTQELLLSFQTATEQAQMAPAHVKYNTSLFVKLFTDPQQCLTDLAILDRSLSAC